MPSSQPSLTTSLDHTIVLVTTNIADTSSRPINAQHLYLPIWGTKLRLRGGRYEVYMAISQPSQWQYKPRPNVQEGARYQRNEK